MHKDTRDRLQALLGETVDDMTKPRYEYLLRLAKGHPSALGLVMLQLWAGQGAGLSVSMKVRFAKAERTLGRVMASALERHDCAMLLDGLAPIAMMQAHMDNQPAVAAREWICLAAEDMIGLGKRAQERQSWKLQGELVMEALESFSAQLQ